MTRKKVSKEEKYDFSMLPGTDVEAREFETKRKEYETLFRELTMDIIVKGTAPDNAEVLYALSCATKHTKENVTPDRLIEMAGLYHPPNSREKVIAALNDLRSMAFVHSEETNRGEAYKLTYVGDSLIGFLDSFSRGAINLDIIKEKLPTNAREIFEKMSERQKEVQRELYRRFRKVEENFKKGI